MPKVIVYLRAHEARALEAEGENPAEWVRGLIKWGLERKGIGREREQVRQAVERTEA